MFFSELTPVLQQMNNGNDKHDNSHISGLRCALPASFSSYRLQKGLVASVTFRTAKTPSLGTGWGQGLCFIKLSILWGGPELLRRL